MGLQGLMTDARRSLKYVLLIAAILAFLPGLRADEVAAHFPEGTLHAFVSLTNGEGRSLAL